MTSEAVIAAYAERERIVREFFMQEAPRLAELCHSMARRFARGGRLLAFGLGAAATDAQHVAVEFVHPVIVGKRALPALALPNDIATLTGQANPGQSLIVPLRRLARPDDIALGITHAQDDAGVAAVSAALIHARAQGLLTVSLGGGSGGVHEAEHVFEVPSHDVYIVQEVQETLYHVLWELVHVFFEHRGLLEDRPPGVRHDAGSSSFLYPFLAEAHDDLQGVLREVRASIAQKAEDVSTLRRASCDADGLASTARLIAERVRAGGKVLVFGNGGSATDAQDLVGDLMDLPGGAGVPAVALTNDAAVMTAVGNDIGFDNVFSRQVIAFGTSSDVAVAISTSGGSRNVLMAIEEAKRRGLMTVGFAGYGGGQMAEVVDRAHVVAGDYVPRLQEAQASQYHSLCRLLADELSEASPRSVIGMGSPR